MKKCFKTAVSLALVCALLFSLCAVSFAADADVIIWPEWDYENGEETTRELPLLGRLSEGDNTDLKARDACYSFSAPQTGYWMFDNTHFFDVSTETDGNRVISICNTIFGGGCIYLEKDTTCYFIFYADDTAECNIRYLGEIVSAEPESDTVYKSKIDFLDDTSTGPYRVYLYNVPVSVKFSGGETVTDEFFSGTIDSDQPGKRIFKADLFNGHGFEMEFTLKEMSYQVESVAFDDDFISTVLINYKLFLKDFETFSFYTAMPEFFEIHFEDGSVVKKEISGDEQERTRNIYGIMLDDGTFHVFEIGYTMPEKGKYVFSVEMDDNVIYSEDAVFTTSFLNADLSILRERIGYIYNHAYYAREDGMPFGNAAKLFFSELSAEIRSFISYNLFLARNGYYLIPTVVKSLFIIFTNGFTGEEQCSRRCN